MHTIQDEDQTLHSESQYTLRKEGIPSEINVDWNSFEEWLKKDHIERVARDMTSYAQKHIDCLTKKDLSAVALLSPGKRRMIMASLAALSKFLGMYEDWRQLTRQYSLKWAGRNSADIIIDRLTKVQDPDEVFQWIHQVKTETPQLSDFIELMAITGMRLIESFNCYNMIISLSRSGNLKDYYDPDKEVLEHYKHKAIFIRKGKKAFISFVPKDLIEKISAVSIPLRSTDMIQKIVVAKGLKQRFSDIREMHASFMTKYLQQAEIDFLHGRVSASVFQQNYFNISLIGDLKPRIFKAIQEIRSKIS